MTTYDYTRSDDEHCETTDHHWCFICPGCSKECGHSLPFSRFYKDVFEAHDTREEPVVFYKRLRELFRSYIA